MNIEEDKPNVRVLLDKDGFLVRAGEPENMTDEIKEEIIQTVLKHGTVKTITYEEYLTLTWIWDKKETENQLELF